MMSLDEKIMPCTKKICSPKECLRWCSGMIMITNAPLIEGWSKLPDKPNAAPAGFVIQWLSFSFSKSAIHFCVWEEDKKKRLHIKKRFDIRADRFAQIASVAEFYRDALATNLLHQLEDE